MWDDAVDMQARLAALKEGAADERARIVAWLDLLISAADDGWKPPLRLVRRGIERGEHTQQKEG